MWQKRSIKLHTFAPQIIKNPFMPKVSVIVPVYNVEKLLGRCLNSILSQTLSDIEVICVDDCSPDNSIDILRKYGQQDPRVKVLRHTENKRQGGARNTGLDIAQGEYVGFVDSDDYLDADFYEKLYVAAKEADADLAITGIIKHRKNACRTVISFLEKRVISEKNEKFKACKCPPEFHPVNKIYRRSMLQEHGIRFQERVMFEDIDFVARSIFASGRVVTVPGTYYRYIYNGESTVKGKETPKKQSDRYNTRKKFLEFARSNGIYVPDKYQNIPVRMYTINNIPVLKIKERAGVHIWRLFDLIPIWRKRVSE